MRCVALVLGLAGSFAMANADPSLTVHVAVDGDDAAAGTEAEPLLTLRAARQRVRDHLAEEPAGDVEVVLHDGVHRLDKPLQFTPDDSAARGHTVTWRAARGAEPRVSGGRRIEGWQEQADGSFTTTIDAVAAGEWAFNELFVSGERRPLARHPNGGYARVEQVGEDRRTSFTFEAGDVPASLDGDLSTTGLRLVFFHDWSSSRTPVASVDQSQRRLATRGEVGPSLSFFHMDNWEADPRYYVENHRSLLDAPGEWYLDRETGRLTYLPKEGESPDELDAVAPVANALVVVRGEPGQPVRGLVFRGLHFEHAAWRLPDVGYQGVQAAFYDRRDGDGWSPVPAALQFELAEDCAVEDGSLRRLGGAGVAFGSRCSNNRVAGNLIDDVAANGVMVGETRSRRVDGEAWWQVAPEQAATGNIIKDNLIQRIGRKYFGSVAIWVGLAADTGIRHNTVRHTPYTGISVGWMWNDQPTPCRGTIIERNYIHHVMQVLSDGGGVYTLGLQPDAVLRHNVIHDIPVNLGRAESNGMFIDEGSTALMIEQNVIYNTDRSPLRFHQAGQNVVRANLLVLPDADTPVFRFNNTPAENIDGRENEVFHADEFDPDDLAEQMSRVGPRVEHADAPDPVNAFRQ